MVIYITTEWGVVCVFLLVYVSQHKYIVYICLMITGINNHKVKYKEDILPYDYKETAKKLYYGGVLVGYYLKDGYQHRNCYIGGNKLSKKAINRHLIALAQMNRDLDVFELIGYAQKYLQEKDGYGGIFRYDETVVANKIDWAWNQEEDFFWVKKNYYFETKLNRETILKIVQLNGASEKRVKILSKIEGALELLKYDSEYITAKSISNISGVKLKTVENYIGIFRDEIDQYNISNFGTKNYYTYIKTVNTESIAQLINSGIMKKSEIARKLNIHYNTVCNLWNNAFDEFNKNTQYD